MQSENTLWVSNNYTSGDPNTASWTQITIPIYPAGDSWVFVNSGNITIPADKYSTNTVIGFKYISTTSGSSTWEIKNLSLTGTCTATDIQTNTFSKKHALSCIGREITISNLENESVFVYDIYGRNIIRHHSTSGKLTLTFPASGIYLIKVGGETYKTMVR